MKKAYATPALVTSGHVVRETLGGDDSSVGELIYKPAYAGSVGYYL